ncbi:MAG: helix-turn-helix domain-containing protein [Micrococcales bacterium]|nr:helix-turn-helix domain-containing protein [Micrococcales bacterium]
MTKNLRFTDRSTEIQARMDALSDEDRELIAQMREQADADDRAYRMQLATVREAGHLTQAEIAQRLGKPQGNVSRTERATDMLYSTLRSYLEAAGAQDIAITATVAGRRVEITLAEAASS